MPPLSGDFTMNKKTKKIKRYIRVILIFTVVSVFFTITLKVSAATTDRYNSWNLCTSQIDASYFYNGGSSLNSSWDVSAQNAWILCKQLTTDFNDSVVDTSITGNCVKMMEAVYDKDYHSQATSYGTRWNRMRNEIANLITDCSTTCPSNNKSDAQTLYTQIQSEYEKYNELVGEIKDTYSLLLSTSSSLVDPLTKSGVIIFNFLWNSLGILLKTIGINSDSANNIFGLSVSSAGILDIVNTILPVIKTFAYAIAVILFGINITQTSLQYEILTLRGGIKVFARILLVKVWIDLSVPVLMFALGLINNLSQQILNTLLNNSVTGFPVYTPVTTSEGTWLSLYHKLISILVSSFSTLPTSVLLVAVCISVISVFVKLLSRGFELTALISLSPIFFSTLVGENTKRYFNRFMSAFLSTAGYVLFMAITYAVATIWISQCTTTVIGSWNEYLKYLMNILPQSIIIIACCRIMRKPPRVLTGLFDGG